MFGWLNSSKMRRTRPNCPYCHGVRCMGICGNNPDEYTDVSICGVVRRLGEHVGAIECDDEGMVFNFEANSEVGREIFESCPPGSRCQLEGQHHEGTLKLVVYIERLPMSGKDGS